MASTQGPIADPVTTYARSKALAFQATKRFIEESRPGFDVINILPAAVIGRDDIVADISAISKGTNCFVLKPRMGYATNVPLAGSSVHMEDIAKLHVLASNPEVPRNFNYLASGANDTSVKWSDVFAIVKKQYPQQYSKGIFKFDKVPATVTVPSKISTTLTTRTFGIQFETFEEQVISVVDQYLDFFDM